MQAGMQQWPDFRDVAKRFFKATFLKTSKIPRMGMSRKRDMDKFFLLLSCEMKSW